MKLKNVSLDETGIKLTKVRKDILRESFNRLKMCDVDSLGLSVDDKLYLFRMYNSIPSAKLFIDIANNIVIRNNTTKRSEAIDDILEYAEKTPLREFFSICREILLYKETCKFCYYCVSVCCVCSFVLEAYGYGTLLGINSKEDSAVFTKDIPSIIESIVLTVPTVLSNSNSELDNQYIGSMISRVSKTPKSIIKIRDHILKRNSDVVNVFYDSVAKTEQYFNSFEKYGISAEFVDDIIKKSIKDVSNYCVACIDIIGYSISYVLRDLSKFPKDFPIHHVNSILSKTGYGLDITLINGVHPMLEIASSVDSIDNTALYYRNVYTKDNGIVINVTTPYKEFKEFDEFNIDSLIYNVTSVVKNEFKAKYFVREEHDLETDEHMLLIDIVSDDFSWFSAIDMKNVSNKFLSCNLLPYALTTYPIYKWLGVLDKVLVDAIDYDNDFRNLLHTVHDMSFDECDEFIKAYYGLYVNLYESISDMMSESNIYYEQPIGWNYGPGNYTNTNNVNSVYVDKMVSVGSYTRKLPYGYKPSEEAKAEAARHYISLEDGKTFVTGFERKTRVKLK